MQRTLIFAFLFVVVGLVAALPTRATPQLNYDLMQITRSMSLYVLDNTGEVDDQRMTTLPGAWNESRTLNGNNGPNPWQVSSSQVSSLDALSITGTGSIFYSTHNDDKSEIDLISSLYAVFSINEAAAYSFASTGSVTFTNLTSNSAMPANGILMPGNNYEVFANVSLFESFFLPDSTSSGAWTVNLQVVPAPGAALVGMIALMSVRRRRCSVDAAR